MKLQARDIPNIITMFRMALVPSVCIAILQEMYGLALLLYAVAGFSDGLDGFIAKRFNFMSRLGSILDPLADKLLLMSTYIVLAWVGLMPVWLVATVVGRDLLIVCGAVAYHYLVGHYDLQPSLISKANTLFQIIFGLAVLVSVDLVVLPEELLGGLLYVVFAVTLLSGADYIYTWGVRSLNADASVDASADAEKNIKGGQGGR